MQSYTINIDAISYTTLNQKLENIQLPSFAQDLQLFIRTPGWYICGWEIKISTQMIAPDFKINHVPAICLKEKRDPGGTFYKFYIAPDQDDDWIDGEQLLEINFKGSDNIHMIEIKACDRISIWKLLHLVRQDISSDHSLRIADWVMDGRKEMNILDQDATVISHLNALNNENAKPYFQNYIWNVRPDVQNACKTIVSPSFNTWYEAHGKIEHSLDDLTESGELPLQLTKVKNYKSRPLGVNLIGYESSLLGIGEDLRTCKEALNTAGIPTKIIDIPTIHTSEELRRQARETPDQIAPYAFNLICMTAEENARIFLELGYLIFNERFNIGYWPWELSKWPLAWRPLFGLVDEVWASSRFTYNALHQSIKHTRKTKLAYMPLAVNPIQPLLNQEKMTVRKSFGLSNQAFLVICSFDGRSSFFRKNPWGAINAFQQAFKTEQNASTELVIKTMNANVDPAEWNRLESVAQNDHRIKLINKKLSRKDILNLYGCCDTLLSLHRSEGFGRILAESLLLDLNVVATNYSGNTDFCEGPNNYPVDFELIDVREGEYVHPYNQSWAEPKIQHASQLLQKLYSTYMQQNGHNNKSKNRLDLSQRHKNLSTKTIGNNYKNRLIKIWNQSNTDFKTTLRWSHENCSYGMEY